MTPSERASLAKRLEQFAFSRFNAVSDPDELQFLHDVANEIRRQGDDAPLPNLDNGSLWGWMTVYPNGKVGLVGVISRDGTNLPLIVGNRDLAERFRGVAQLHAEKTGQRVWLREFSGIIDHGDA